jgi:hypothetical protein
MDVGGWLRGLGLEQYEAAFRENDIDETVLPGLTHETLKELGVASVGHRVKLLDAIAALRAEASAPTPPLETDKSAKHTAERRFARHARLSHFISLRGRDLRETRQYTCTRIRTFKRHSTLG